MQFLIRHKAILATMMALLGAPILTGCATSENLSKTRAEMAQSPITDHPSGRTYPGKFIWHDLLTPDPLVAGKFYEALFGWTIDYQEHYAVARINGKRVAGILKPEITGSTVRDGLWIPTVSVDDVDAAADRVIANGGEILKGPVDMKSRGRAVFVSDPQRADLLLLQAKGGDPADTEPVTGGWLWDEIWTRDSEAVEDFYSSILGYDGVISGDNYSVLLRDNKWRAGIRQVKEDIKHRLWVPVIRVVDPEATARRVPTLGGVVWVAPEDAPNKGETALIADPTGALLLIQKWPSQSTKREPGQ